MRPTAAASRGPLAGTAALVLALGALLPVLLLPGWAQAAPTTAPGGLVLELTGMTPRVVTADGPADVTVTGTLRNTSTRAVGELEVRLQRGDALRGDGAVRDALGGTTRTDVVVPDFVPLPGVLEPGGTLPLSLAVPVAGTPDDGLALTRPGVYPLLVNVNGVPRDGVRARLVATRLLLPVLSVPGGPAPQAGPAAGVTVLYPLADEPRRLPTVPGEQTLLTDDDLARSLAPTGRLGGLLAAYTDRAPPGSPVRTATCLAVDPDLVGTVAAMRQGYLVRRADGTTAPGTGAPVAAAWLDGLAAAARGGCVVALPFADADLGALARGSLAPLAELAVSDGRAVVADVLGTPVVDATTWPAGGALDETGLGAVAAARGRAVILRADAVDSGRSTPTAGVVGVAAPGATLTAVLADPLLSRAADGPADDADADRTLAVGVGAPVSSTDAGASPPFATQDALATLVYRAQSPPPADGPVVLAPPHVWTADAAGAGALLDALGLLLDSDRLQPRALTGVVAAGPTNPEAVRRPADPLQAGGDEVPAPVLQTVRDTYGDVVDLQSAAVPETGVGAPVDATFGPLLQAVLRPASAAWHGRPDLAAASAALASGRIGQLRESIRVLPPPSPYSLGTRNAPLLLTVANGLPVTMEVRLSISSSTGLRVAPIPAQRVPPLGRRQVQVDAQVVRSGQFVVEAMVRTPGGRALGPPSRLQVRSTAYGTITVWLTGCASVLLVVLAARRVVRRIRGESGRSDRIGPPTGPTPPSAPPPGPADRTPPDRAPPGPADAEAPTRPVPATSPPAEPEPPTRPVPRRPDPEPPTRPVPARRR